MIEKDDTNSDEINDAFYKDPIAWKRYQNGDLKNFPRQAKTKVSKVWHYFVCAKLQPITNFSVIMKNQAALVYAIQENKKIDIGLIIQHSILHGFETAIQGFVHPYLITELCRQAEIKWNKKKELRALKVIIDNALLLKICEDDDEAPRLAGVGNSQP